MRISLRYKDIYVVYANVHVHSQTHTQACHLYLHSGPLDRDLQDNATLPLLDDQHKHVTSLSHMLCHTSNLHAA
jgi:hypothetical protein